MILRLAVAMALLSVLLAPASSSGQTTSLGYVGVSVVVRVNSMEGGPLDVGADVALNLEGGAGIDEQTGTTAEAQFDRVAPGHYEIAAEARGYKPGHASLLVDNSRSAFYVEITLERDPTQPAQPVSKATLLAPKARKEMEKGVAAIKSSNYHEAQTHLENAHKLAPGDPDINYLLGLALAGLKQNSDAQKYLSAAISLKPDHVPALTALGGLDLESGNLKGAEELFEKVTSIDWSNWRAHWLLAEAFENDRNHEKAAQEAESAVAFGKSAAGGAQLVLGKALAGLGRREEAIQAFQNFLADSPNSPLKEAIEQEIALLKSQLAAARPPQPLLDAVAVTAPTTGTPKANPESAPLSSISAVPAIESAASLPTWGPPSVSQATPPVSPGVACPASHVIDEAGARMVEFVAHMNNIDATEELVHERLDEIGKPISTEKRSFDYLVTVAEVSPGILRVDELRNGTDDPNLFPENLATLGVPAFALAFHPALRSDFDMTCEGLGDLHGRPAWIVRFVQKSDRPARLRSYRIERINHPVPMEGRAWIATDTFQIMRLETDLVRPMPQIQLIRDHAEVEYKPVQFRSQNVTIWLPSSAQLYFEYRKQRYHRSDTLSRYRLFAVNETQKINQPPPAPESQ